jgi:membrane associated rhomboid family serine protease
MDKIKAFLNYQWKHGGIAIKIIAVNLAVFLLYLVLNSILGWTKFGVTFNNIFDYIFVADASINGLISKPWAIITYNFAHSGLLHLLMNMFILFFAQKMFVPLFGEKRFIWVYFLGGIFGYFLELTGYELMKPLQLIQEGSHSIVGASACVTAVLITVIAHNPKQRIKLFGAFEIPFYVLGIVVVGGDLIGLFKSGSGTAHLAHLGGALIGFLAGYKASSPNNVFNYVASMFDKKPTPRKTPPKDDFDYVSKKKEEENQINIILEKIKLNGYDSLTKKEKEKLFTASNKK